MNVLIVDDNQDNRMTIELLLEDVEEINITEAVDGQDAILKCKEQIFDLIFMDIMMPKVDGIEATKEIKAFCPTTMIIALSALDDERSKHAMLQSGAEDYITKPIEAKLFMQRVKNYITIVSLRSKQTHTTTTVSLFSDTGYPLSRVFTIDSEAALAYFWDYSLNSTTCKANNISDIVRIIYGIGLWILKTKRTFSITLEENDENYYITQASLGSLSEVVIRNILLKHCPSAIYILKNKALSFKLTKVQHVTDAKSETISQEDMKIISLTHDNKITATEYVDMTAISFIDKMDSLERLEESLDIALLDFEQEHTEQNIQKVSQLFMDYIEVIQQLVEFEHLSYAITSLADFLAKLKSSQFDENKVKKLIILTVSLVSDLSSWRENIFVLQEANDIHYLDSSLLSSCLQIESIFEEIKPQEEDGDLEFF